MKKQSKRSTTIKRPRLQRRKKPEERLKEAFANVPRITNETVAEHREDVLRGARKFIYPLKHSRRRAVIISSTIFVAALIVFMVVVLLSLYRFQSTSGFMYGVTKVLPLPVAKAGDSWVSYNSYLFELKHYMHYYETQQDVDFESESGKQQLANYKKQALQQVINDAYVKQLATNNGVNVSNRALNNQVDLVRSQNRLGASQREFEEVLQEFWGWDRGDFRRSLRQQMLAQAVVAKLDTDTQDRAKQAQSQLQAGQDFAKVAKTFSDDDASKENGGEYGFEITRNNADLPAEVMAALFRLQPGEQSGIINTGYTLEIVRVNSSDNGKINASHIVFRLDSINKYVDPLKQQSEPTRFISVD